MEADLNKEREHRKRVRALHMFCESWPRRSNINKEIDAPQITFA